MRPPAYHAAPHGIVWAVRRSGRARAIRTGLSAPTAWRLARQLADRAGALAYRFDENGRVAEVYAKEPDVLAVNVARRDAVTDTGRHCAITNLFDENGDDTEDATRARSAVARLDDNHWLSIDLTQFDATTVN